MTANSPRPLDNLLSLLTGVVPVSNGSWKAYCPIHEDDGQRHDPSLQITETDDGTVLVYCHVCKDDKIGPRICTHFGIPIRSLFPDWARTATEAARNKKNRSHGKKTAEFEYRDIDGIVVYKSTRYERPPTPDKPDGSKEFVLSRPNGRGGWVSNIRNVTRIPYRLPELVASAKEDKIVFIPEGEKKVEALMKWGLVATCNAGGAKKWLKEWSNLFRGRKVVILPDNDPVNPADGSCPGWEHATKVLDCLKPAAAIVRILDLPDLPLKGDIVDWQNAGHTLAEFLELVDAVLAGPETRPSAPSAPAIDNPLSIVYFAARTDVASGQRLVKKHGDGVRYCQPMGKWLVWTGRRWVIDQMHAVDRLVTGCTKDLWNETAAIKSSGTFPLIVEKMEKWCAYSDSVQGLTRAIRAAQAEKCVQVLPKHLDKNPWLMNVKNGTLNLETGDLQPHDPSNLLTKISPVEFDVDAKCPTWERFVKQVFRSDVEVISYIKRLCGYWATGHIREQILPIFWGSGSNGKTTFLNVILEVLGLDYAMKAPQDFLMAKRGDSHPTEKADLFGKRFVACSETEEGRRLSESLVKELTGKERIRARRMREDFWEFDPTHKIVMLTNHRPIISGSDHGIWRRIRLIEFSQRFWDASKGENGPPELRQDKILDETLRTEYPGILRWIVEGCQVWHHDEEMVPMAVEVQTMEYRESQDTISQWIEERCERNLESRELVSDLYADYREWVVKTGEFPVSQRKFSMTLSDSGFKKIKISVMLFQGLSLRYANSIQ